MVKEYVRLTFRPAGATRDKTIWAIVVKRGPKYTTYKQVTSEGDEEYDGGKSPEGLPIEQTRLIVTETGEAREQPARMSLMYGDLEVEKVAKVVPVAKKARKKG